MNAPVPMSFEEEEFLTLRIAGGSGVNERLLLVGRPRQGNVRVREWTTETFNTAGHEYDIPAGELLGTISAAYAAGRSLGAEWYRVQRWLEG